MITSLAFFVLETQRRCPSPSLLLILLYPLASLHSDFIPCISPVPLGRCYGESRQLRWGIAGVTGSLLEDVPSRKGCVFIKTASVTLFALKIQCAILDISGFLIKLADI